MFNRVLQTEVFNPGKTWKTSLWLRKFHYPLHLSSVFVFNYVWAPFFCPVHWKTDLHPKMQTGKETFMSFYIDRRTASFSPLFWWDLKAFFWIKQLNTLKPFQVHDNLNLILPFWPLQIVYSELKNKLQTPSPLFQGRLNEILKQNPGGAKWTEPLKTPRLLFNI